MKMLGLSRTFFSRSSWSPASFALATCASACSKTCMGDPSSKTAGAANGAIFMMLGFVALMLGFIGAFIYHPFKTRQRAGPPARRSHCRHDRRGQTQVI